MASAENIELGFIPQEAPALPPEVSSPGSVSFGGTTFFYAQNYFGLSDPQNIENLLIKNGYVIDTLSGNNLNFTGISTFNNVYVSGSVGIGSTDPTQRLDVTGSVKIDNFIYDRDNSAGFVGWFLTRDASGIRWAEIAPGFGGNIIVLEEGNTITGSTGISSFSGINFISGSGAAPYELVDLQVSNINPLYADITIKDFWTKSGGSIYRNSNVGINIANPSYSLDVLGDANIDGIVYARNDVFISDQLFVSGISSFSNDVNVSGVTSLSNNLFVYGQSYFNNRVQITGITSIFNNLTVTGITTLQSNLDVGGPTSLNNTLKVLGITTLHSNLNVGGATSLGGNLKVTGITTLHSNLNVDGPTRLNNTLNVSGITTLQSNLNVGGATSLASTLDVNGASNLNNTLKVLGITTLHSNLNVGGATSLGSTLKVTGITTLHSDLNVDGPTRLNNTLNVSGIATLQSNLNVDGPTRLNNTLNVSGISTLQSNLNVDGPTRLNNTLNVSGITTLQSNLNVDGPTDLNNTLNVDGPTDLNNTLKVSGITTLQSILNVDGQTNLNSVLDVDGPTRLNNTLNVSGITTLQSILNVDGPSNLNNTLKVSGISTLQSNLNVDGPTRLNNTLNVSGISTLQSNLNVGGPTRLNNDLNVSGITTLQSNLNVDGPTDLNNTLNVSGITTFQSNLNVDGPTDLNNTLNVSGITTLQSNLNVDGPTDLNNNLNVNAPTSLNDTLVVAGLTELQSDLYVEGTTNLLEDLNVTGNTKLTGTLELDNALIDVNGSTAVGKTDYRLASVGTGVSWRPPGVQTQNAIWVTVDGNDSNSGYLEGDAKRTVGAAASIAQPGDTIFIRSGVYNENNPIGLRTDVSVSGQDLRLVTIVPNNPTKDVFHVRRGCLIENLNFAGSSVAIAHTNCGAVAFPPTLADINAGIAFNAVTGYTELGPATEGESGRWRSPYIRNCTNFMTKSIGMKINGDHATASTIGADLKSMVCDSFTQYNENGIGVSITNNGYAQLVSIFTINCDIGIFAATGGSCDLTNSNSSFGNFGLVATGLGATEFTGKVNADTDPEVDTVVLKQVYDELGNPRRPYDGQALWFQINLDNYPDAVGVGTITAPLRELSSITILNGGSGFSAASPPNVIIRDADGTVQPKGPQGIIAEVSPTINDSGEIIAIDVISTGRNYLSTQNIVVDVEGNTGLATAVMSPIYYTVSVASSTTPSPTGITTVTFNEFVPYELFENDAIELRRISRILTSSHSFEYIGTGTDINTATPLKGAVPIKANEVVARDGAQIPFTSTDQKGNFDIGEGIQIDQTTSTIRGRDFSRAIQAEVTPLILALR